MKTPRIIFMGTPEFAATALRALHASGHDLIAVYTQPPRPKGRGQSVQNSAVHAYALAQGIPVFHPVSLKKEDEQKKFAALKPDIAVVAAYGLILPRAILSTPVHGCVNIHASLLPRWRGASPIQRAIWAGDAQTGVTLMQMDEGLDTGPMIEKRTVAITPQTTAATLHDELAALGGTMIVDLINHIAHGKTITAQAQENEFSTYAPLLTKDDGRVNWNQSAQEIDRQIRALNPWPGVWTMVNGKRLKILSALPEIFSSPRSPGTVMDDQPRIHCAQDTALRLMTVQPENAKAMPAKAAINGGYFKPGDSLA